MPVSPFKTYSYPHNLMREVYKMIENNFHKKDKIFGFLWGKVIIPPSKDPLHLDRIKVWVPSFPKYEDSFGWVKPLGLGYGHESGIMQPPAIDDEVLLFFLDGSKNHPYYLHNASYDHQLPKEHYKNNKPEYRWMIKTPGGHWIKYMDDPLEQMIQLLTIDGAELALDDTNKQIRVVDHDKRHILMDSNADRLEVIDAIGNQILMQDGGPNSFEINHGPTDSHLHMESDGNVELHAQEKLFINAKEIYIDPTTKIQWHRPATYVECIDDGTDFFTCGAQRQSKCFDCETGQDTGETPPTPGLPEIIDGGNF